MNEEWAREFGLNYAQMRYVQDMIPGNEATKFAEALVGGGLASRRCRKRRK
jgi:hypothetical protein